MQDERKLARVTATSEEPINQVMRIVRHCLAAQITALSPVRPRVLFAAIGQRHAEQISRIANAHGIACATLHHSMSGRRNPHATRTRFEAAVRRPQAIVQSKMLGQGYDLPPITVVVPMRPYGSFGEFYQFIGRGIRVVHHPALASRTDRQHLDVIYHGELGLDEHLETYAPGKRHGSHTRPTVYAFGDVPVPDSPPRQVRTTVDWQGAVPILTPLCSPNTGETHQQFLHDVDKS